MAPLAVPEQGRAATKPRQRLEYLHPGETQQAMLLHEDIEVDGIKITSGWIRESGHVAWRNRPGDPLRKFAPLIASADFATGARQLAQAPQGLARQRLQHRVSDAEEAV